VRLDDPDDVQAQYGREDNLLARRSLWEHAEGERATEVVWETIAELAPRRVLEVGGGPGELSARMRDELGAQVSFVDVSPRMVELARGRGLDAQVGDVQELPFGDASFDTVVAAWMLYHVPDLDRGLAEIARVLVPGGTLVAVTNSVRHIEELDRLIGALWEDFGEQFNAENGEESLRRHLRQVGRRDVVSRAVVPDRDTLVAYRESLSKETRPIPEDIELPFVLHGRVTIFTAVR
jgi:SAM-dependent methyltransferase